MKTYIRLNREKLSRDGELLSLLLPERFAERGVGDLQRLCHREVCATRMPALRTERDSLKGAREQVPQLGDAVQTTHLELLDARTFEEAIRDRGECRRRIRRGSCASFCVEGDGAAPKHCEGVRHDRARHGLEFLGPRRRAAQFCPAVAHCCWVPRAANAAASRSSGCRSAAKHRRCLYVLGAREAGRFEGEELTPTSPSSPVPSNAASGHGSICRSAEARLAGGAHP